jgi:poly-gamma-glutamate capsule biosynthesis protein CapA/YwtB (metallophosphatase superfamily)
LLTLFLSGDVMTGRGIDQILPHPAPPRLHEGYLTSARQYVEIAEQANGPIPKPVEFNYIWGEALAELDRVGPDFRIINLETAVTLSEAWHPKGINYRMHPENVPCLTAAGIDCCVLANNHVLDWGEAGLIETLETLEAASIGMAGAGRNQMQAEGPAVLEAPGKGRILVFSFGDVSSGVPPSWAASETRPGVNLVPNLSKATAERIAKRIRTLRQPGDVVVVSIHWGANWGYEIPSRQRAFAHALIDGGGADILHGHSSHHPKGLEVYRNRPILYGCGDFLNDYEGIGGYEEFRDDLTLMYFPTVDQDSGELQSLTMAPMQIRNFCLNRPSARDAAWLASLLDRESRRFGTQVETDAEARLHLRWK